MTTITSSISKKCVTCAMYAGVRAVNGVGQSVKYDSNAEGICAVKRKAVKAGSIPCNKFEKWGALR